mgnify:CR=1 FL=1
MTRIVEIHARREGEALALEVREHPPRGCDHERREAAVDHRHGAVQQVWYWSANLKQMRRMHVYTPPGYESGGAKYPVFYLLHGAGDSDDAWTSVGRAGFILDNLIASKKAAGRAGPGGRVTAALIQDLAGGGEAADPYKIASALSRGDAGGWIPVPNAYLSWAASDRLWLGLGVNVPFGLTTEWDADWTGRFKAVKSEVQTINVNPSLAVKLGEAVSIGGGVSYQRLTATLSLRPQRASPPRAAAKLLALARRERGWGRGEVAQCRTLLLRPA